MNVGQPRVWHPMGFSVGSWGPQPIGESSLVPPFGRLQEGTKRNTLSSLKLTGPTHPDIVNAGIGGKPMNW